MQELTKKIIEIKESALIELAQPYEELIKELLSNSASNTKISVPYHLFRQLQSQIPETFAKIDSQKNYLSLKRLQEFENKDFFENHEISALLKYLIWKEQTKTGLLSEVGLFGQERQTTHYVNIDESIEHPEEEPFFKNALENDSQTACLRSHQYIVDVDCKRAQSTSAKQGEESPYNQRGSGAQQALIIVDLENFIESLRFNLSIYTKLDFSLEILNDLLVKAKGNKTVESLISKITIFFGLAGILFDKGNDQNFFAPRSAILAETLESKEWLDLKKSAQNLIELSMELVEIMNTRTAALLTKWKQQLKLLQDFFSTPNLQTHYSWLEKAPQGNIILRKIPYSIKEPLNEILKQYTNYKIISENLDLIDDAQFIKKMSGLAEELPLHKLKQKSENLEITLLKDINDGDKNQIPNFLEAYLQKDENKKAMIFTAKQNLEFVTIKLGQSNIPTISQLTASSGKMQEQFKDASDNPLILVTPNLWENLEISKQIDILLIHKIPFAPPSDPHLLAQSQLYEDPFKELQIPLAIFALKKIIHRLDSTKPKKIIIFDSRLITKEYGDQFIQNLEELGSITIKKIKDVDCQGN